jgi:hypothetical protein
LTLASYVISLRAREHRMRKSSRFGLIAAILAVSALASSCTGILLKNNATLSSLTIQSNDGTVLALSPTFDPLVIAYTATVAKTATSLSVTAAATNSAATVTGTGSRDIISTLTEVDVTVVAPNDEATRQIYRVTVSKASE